MFMRRLFLFLFFLPGLAFSGATPAPIVEEIISVMESIPPCKTKEELVAHYHKLFDDKIQQFLQQACKVHAADYQACLLAYREMEKLSLHEWRAKLKELGLLGGEENLFRLKKLENPRIVQIIRGVLEEFGINPQHIALFSNDIDDLASAYGLGADNICINEFAMYISDHSLKAVIAHEVQHILFKDVTMGIMCLFFIHPEKDRNINIFKSGDVTVDKIRLIHEIRADVLAALKSPYYALSMENLLQDALYSNIPLSQTAAAHHPTLQQRIKIVQMIQKQLKQCLQDKKDLLIASVVKGNKSHNFLYSLLSKLDPVITRVRCWIRFKKVMS
jgi:hypothetical protein